MEDSFTQQNNTNNTHTDDMWIEEALATVRVREFVLAQALGEERAEQERTKDAKRRFLEVFEDTMCTITLACAQAGVTRDTYYKWMKYDAQFRSTVAILNDRVGDQVEDRLKKLIQQDTPASVHFWLDRKDPRYRKSSKLEIETKAGRSLEEQLYEKAAKKKAEAEKQNGVTTKQ